MPPAARSRHAMSWLRTEPGFARLGEQAARLAELQADLSRCLPDLPLTVVALERDVLVVGTAHAAVAAKVRQRSPTVLAALARSGWRISGIRFRPRFVPPPPPRTRMTREPPGPDAVERIAALSGRVADPRLAAALRRLAARHTPRDTAD